MNDPGTNPTSARDSADAPPRRRANVEVIIPTFNEEINLPFALASVIGWADAVHVVDSESTDATHRIARDAGANLVVQPWLGYAKQKNWALDNLPVKADWVFILDADESVTPELRDELLRIAAEPVAGVGAKGFYVNRLTHFMGKPIRHCGFFPSYNLRFFQRGMARYEERSVHEHMVVQGVSGRLANMMLHEDRRGLEHFIAKHNRYSTLEARELRKANLAGTSGNLPNLERGVRFRRWLKHNVLPKLPLTGLWRFFYMYIVRLGFLDGAAGLRFCLLLSMYDTFIALKLAELRAIDQRGGASPVRASGTLPVAKVGGLAVPEGEVSPTGPSSHEVPKQSIAQATIPNTAAALTPAVAASAPTTPSVPHHRSTDAPLDAGAEWAPRSAHPEQGPPLADPRHPNADALAEALNPLAMPSADFPPARSVPVSILVPVKNEQRHIVDCLRRCQWATELIVADSKSTDQTIPLAQAMGADVYQFFYDRSTGWPKKKNWALDQVPWKNEWVMILDADEYMTPELAQEIRRVVEGNWKPEGRFGKSGCGDGFWVNRRFMFMGSWIRGCGFYPSWNVRLLKHKLGRYERIGTLGDTGSGDNEVHEHITLSTGKAGYLANEFLHYAYPDLSIWVEKHNRYTTWEAHAMEAKDEGAVRAKMFGEPIERRRWIKAKARKLPFRPTLRFLYSFFVQRGFLDGYPGFVMCRLLAWYEFMSIAKNREMHALKSEAAKAQMQQVSGRPLS
jgi:glycosyltransferase involved in cell wall biosynthesis